MIEGFASYGFPESHAASFALIAYASGYLKAHHPVAFYTALLNAWPMGFYHPATIVQDAQRHGVPVLPVDVNFSGWRCSWERSTDRQGSVRLGLRFVKGLSEAGGKRIETERLKGRYRDAEHLRFLCHLRRDEMERLAFSGAMTSFGLKRREALWQVAQVGRPLGPLFEGRAVREDSPLPEMTDQLVTTADYDSTHLMAYWRSRLRAAGVLSRAELEAKPDKAWVKTAGSVIVRQRPGSAKGFVFLTLEDETGMSQAIIRPQLFDAQRELIVSTSALIVEGVLQKEGPNLSIRAHRVYRIDAPTGVVKSHDFR
jgi:error-prone DNA polymerase